MDESAIARSELRWTLVVFAVLGAVFVAIVSATLALHDQPPSHRETIDPTTMHVSGEFVEGNLGTTANSDGSVTARIVATQFAFVPQCTVVPQGKPVTFRLASPDVIHGILVTGTNVNTMVVPGYVSEVHTVFARSGDYLMPCHEFCGLGHGEMMAHIRVVPAAQFNPDKNGRVGCGPG